MGHVHKPRSGTLQFWPRVRAKRQYPRIRSWLKTEKIGLLGFAGYKAGMTQVLVDDSRKNSMTKGEKIVFPATVISCPPLKVYAIRLYSRHWFGKHVLCDVLSPHLDKTLQRKVTLPKKKELLTVAQAQEKLSRAVSLTLLMFTQPSSISSQKKPEIFEIGLGGKTIQEQFQYASSLFGKDVRVSDVFSEHVFVDVHAVTKGKGFQGSIKRFGMSLKSHKSEKKKRAVGNLGSFNPSKVRYTVGQPGKMGYHTRVDFCKQILALGTDGAKVTPRGGFLHYGPVKGDYVLLKGSLPGPAQRLVRLCASQRKQVPQQGIAVRTISLESPQ